MSFFKERFHSILQFEGDVELEKEQEASKSLSAEVENLKVHICVCVCVCVCLCLCVFCEVQGRRHRGGPPHFLGQKNGDFLA